MGRKKKNEETSQIDDRCCFLERKNPYLRVYRLGIPTTTWDCWDYVIQEGNKAVLKKNDEYGYYFSVDVSDNGEFELFKGDEKCDNLWELALTISDMLIGGVKVSAETKELGVELRKLVEEIEEGKPLEVFDIALRGGVKEKKLVYVGERGELLKKLGWTGLFEFVPVDMSFARNVPKITGQHRVLAKGEIDLKLDKIIPKDIWVILYLYHLSDPTNISKVIEADIRELYKGLNYPFYTGRGKKEMRSDITEELKDSLIELCKPLKITLYHEGKNKQGEWRESYIPILGYLDFRYSDKDFKGKEPINLGTEERPVEIPKGARPRAVGFSLNTVLMQGLKKRGMNFWKMSKELFSLRDQLNPNEFKFVFWVLTQEEKNYLDTPYMVKIGRDKLIKQLGFGSKDKKRNEQTLLRAYGRSKELGILEGYELDVPNADGRGVSDVFYRSDRFYFKKEDKVKDPKMLKK